MDERLQRLLNRRSNKKELDYKQTLCWKCERAYGAESKGYAPCSWSEDFTPVEGWEAERTTVTSRGDRGTSYGSYLVKSCPKYVASPNTIEPDEETISVISKELEIPPEAVEHSFQTYKEVYWIWKLGNEEKDKEEAIGDILEECERIELEFVSESDHPRDPNRRRGRRKYTDEPLRL